MTDYISRADAIEVVCRTRCGDKAKGCPAHSCLVIEEFDALLSADAEFADLPDIPRAYYERIVGNMAHEINMLKEQLESADAVQGWIPCSERLPKKGEVVLITNGKGNVRCGQYRSEHDVRDGTHYWWWKGKTVETVLAWMPLPEPYREESEVGE